MSPRAHYVLATVNYVRKYRVTVSPIVNGRAHPRGEFLLGRRGTVRDKADVLIGVPPLAFLIAEPELRSAFDRIVLNAYLRGGPTARDARRSTASNSRCSR